MAVYIVTGKLGAGKSLFTSSLIADAAERGRRIVTNFDINLSHLRLTKDVTVDILPTNPNSDQLFALGYGSDREDKPGLIVFDEGAIIFNNRTWSDKDRQKLINWFLLSRKLKWDVFIIIQHISALDKQLREMIAELIVTCMRLDRIKIPLLKIALPRLHIAIARYGSQPGAPVAERWFYRGGKRLYNIYDTAHIFDPNATQLPVRKLTFKGKPTILMLVKKDIAHAGFSPIENIIYAPTYILAKTISSISNVLLRGSK